MSYHFAQPEFLSRRALALAGIVALHIVVGYLLLSALGQAAPVTKDTPTVGFILPTPPATVVERRPDYLPDPYHGPIEVRTPEPIATTPESAGPAAVAVGGLTSGAGTAEPVPAPIRVIGRNQLPDTEDYYPPDLRRNGVQGATSLRVCVDESGLRQAEPVIEESSGNPRLDMGAVNIARHGRYARSVQGATPVGNCYRFRISFRIR